MDSMHPKHQQAQAFLSAFANILTPVWFACILEGCREEASASAVFRLMILMLQSSPAFAAAFEEAGGFAPLVLSIPKFSTCASITMSMLSGTATLEAMLLRKPMIVCYRLAALTYMIASRIVDVPHIAWPNLLAGERLVPEFVQHEVTEREIESQILQFFADPGAFTARLDKFEQLHRDLRKDASAAAAAAIQSLVLRGPAGIKDA